MNRASGIAFQTERLMSDPRCAGLVESTLGEGRLFCTANGASPLGFCGASRKPDNPAFAEDPMGDENAVSVEPTIMAASINNMT